MTTELYVFVSSKMQELAPERQALQALLPTLGQGTFNLRTWIFEGDAPASNKPIREVYLEALQNSALYLGLFWNEFGEWTIDEFERAAEWGIERHMYVKDVDSHKRDPRLQAFLDRQSDVRFGITPRWFTSIDDLKDQVSKSIAKWLLDRQIAYHSATSAILAQTPDDVPEQPRKLVGRENLQAEIQALLDAKAHVLLQGFGGMGKTALAAAVAANYVAESKGQVLWIKAGSVAADALFEALGRALGAPQAVVSTTGDERLQTVRHLLADAKALLVIDDVWNGNALARVLKAVPRNMPMLVTSRYRFPLDEIIEVGELPPDQAIELLNLHARRQDFTNDPKALRLCQILGNHAFALEIAGKTLKVYQLTPGELAQRLEDTPHDLSMPSNFGEIGRTGIKALMDTSVSALHKELHDVYVFLGGMFEPSTTPELLARAMRLDQQEVVEALNQLELRGLVNARSSYSIAYYRLHDLAYSYARTMFLNKGLDHQAVVQACRDYATAYKDDLDALDVEQSNILEAAEAAYQSNNDDLFVDILRVLTVDGPFFAARGHTALSLNLLRLAIEAAKKDHQLETAHYLLSKLGNAYADFFGDIDNALKAYQEALELAKTLGNTLREAILLTVIGKMYFQQNRQDADDYYARAEDIARHLDDDYALSFVLHHRGYQFINKLEPDYERGRELSDEAAKIAARVEMLDIQFWSLINRGSSEHELGQIETALATHREAYDLACRENNHDWMAGALRSIGEDYHQLGKPEEAQQAFDEALHLWRQIKAQAQAKDLIRHMEDHNYTVQPEM